jgi:hypothetical protein
VQVLRGQHLRHLVHMGGEAYLGRQQRPLFAPTSQVQRHSAMSGVVQQALHSTPRSAPEEVTRHDHEGRHDQLRPNPVSHGRPAVQIELSEQVLDVSTHSAVADAECLRDNLVSLAARHPQRPRPPGW